MIRFYCVSFLHLHSETEHASFVGSPGVDTNSPIARFDYLFDHFEAKTYSFIVHLCRTLKLAEAGEELGHVFASNTCSRVLHIHHKQSVRIVSLYTHKAMHRKFERIFNKIHKNLFESATIAIELG